MVLFTIPEMIFPQLFWLSICCIIVALFVYKVFIPRISKAFRLRNYAIVDMQSRITVLLEQTQLLENNTRKLEEEMQAQMQNEIIKLYKEFEIRSREDKKLIQEGFDLEEKRLEIEMIKTVNKLKLELKDSIPEISNKIIDKLTQ